MRVASMPVGVGGVAFYRLVQPLTWNKEQGRDVFLFDQTLNDGNRLRDEQMNADVIVFQCPWSESIRDAVRLIKQGGKKAVVEMDDNLFAVSPWNEKYCMFGVEEIAITYSEKKAQQILEALKTSWMTVKENPDKSKTFSMWKDGCAGFNLEQNRTKARATVELLQECDLVTCTTPELGKQLRKVRKEGPIAILPNLIDFSRWLPMKPNESDEIRIGWQGGSAHFADLALVASEMVKFAQKHPKVKYVIKGVWFPSLFEDISDRIEWLPWHGDINTYPLDMRDMRLDIGLCPLVDDPFNRGKSPLKWLEYSALKIPTIASPTVYEDYIDYGKTGLVARQGEWFNAMESLLDKKARDEMSEKAYARVKTKYSVEQSQMWWDAYEDLVRDQLGSKKLILNMN